MSVKTETPVPPREAAPKMQFSPAKVATAGVLAVWAFLFWFVIIDGRSLLYVSTRTRWVVPVGAVVMTAAAIGRIWTARTRFPEPVPKRETTVLALMVVPALMMLALPPVSLSSFALKNKSSFTKRKIVISPEQIAHGPLTLVEIASSPATELGKKALAGRSGDTVTFVGFVAIYPDTAPGEFYLTRYVITCCVADATIAQVRVVDVTPGAYKNDQWVQVTGTFYSLGSEAIVDASKVTKIPAPKDPYLTP